jgi:hypothetical protein
MAQLSLSLSVLSKVDRKISVSFVLIQNFKISDSAMAKVEKVNIAVTYSWVISFFLFFKLSRTGKRIRGSLCCCATSGFPSSRPILQVLHKPKNILYGETLWLISSCRQGRNKKNITSSPHPSERRCHTNRVCTRWEGTRRIPASESFLAAVDVIKLFFFVNYAAVK